MSTLIHAPLSGRTELANWDPTMSWLYFQLKPESEEQEPLVYIVSKRLHHGRFSMLTEGERRRWLEVLRRAASEGKRTLFGYSDELVDGFRAPESQAPLFVVAVERDY